MRTPRNFGVTVAACVVFVAAMVGATYAAVPLYRMFCQATGFGGTPVRAEKAPDSTLDRVVTVRFDANIAGLDWTFRPAEREVRLKLGEVGQVSFLAANRAAAAGTGAATFNVTPEDVAPYFNKIACFCFTDQTLAAGERVELPVTFFIDPAMAADTDLANTDTITLSYTFFPATPPAKPVAAIDASGRGG